MTRHTYRFLDLLIKVLRVVAISLISVCCLLIVGCAQGIVYKPAPKPTSTVAENTEAIGNQVARLLGVLKLTEK